MTRENGSSGIIAELAYNIQHIRQSFELRTPNDKEAITFLAALTDTLSQPNPYFQPGENAQSLAPLASGFFFSTYRFATESGDWVAKIGLPESPMKGFPHPSSRDFTTWYTTNLNLQRQYFQKELPHLIPDPQIAEFVHAGDRSTTVVLQPFINNIHPLKYISSLPKEGKQQIGEELRMFDSIVRRLQDDHGLTPDMLRAKNHFVIAPKEDGPHLVLLDNGLFDDQLDAKAMNRVNRITYTARIALEKAKLRQN